MRNNNIFNKEKTKGRGANSSMHKVKYGLIIKASALAVVSVVADSKRVTREKKKREKANQQNRGGISFIP